MAHTEHLKTGDKVTWKTPQGETHGVVEAKLTSKSKVEGHTATPTKADPQFKVKSDKTGAKAIHKPEALKKA